MCGAVKPLFVLPFYFLRLLQGWESLNQSKRAAASVDEFHQLCDSPANHLRHALPPRFFHYIRNGGVILWFFDRLRKAPALLPPEPSLSLTLQVQRKF